MPTSSGEGDIVVTGTRLRGDDDSGGGGELDFLFWSTYSWSFDPFSQYGGNETPEIATFQMIDGDVYVQLQGYSVQLKLPAADWGRMNDQQRGEFIKMMTEFRESPGLVQSLDRAQGDGLARIDVRFGPEVHRANGAIASWGPNEYGRASIATVDNKVTAVVININSNLVPGADGTYDNWTNTQGESGPITFSLVFLHEMRHIHYVSTATPHEGAHSEEWVVRMDADQMMDDIYNTPGATERSPLDYLQSQTWIGSRHNDNATGSGGNDTMSGLTGNDTLNGAAGDDLVLGGAGMDVLSGGIGTNYVHGGLDADIYVPQAGVTAEIVSELGGVDRIELSRISMAAVQFTRYGDDLVMVYATAAGFEEVWIQNQWGEGTKVEQFTFSEGTYAASYIESLAGTPSGACYDAMGQPMICGPYGMPIVFDLDGDGIELVPITESHARFDVDGDGARERIGWVGADDGVLALDRNGNGRIDDFSEISFLQDFLGAGSDLEGLLAYDSDGDGYLTKADARFGEFLVWRDVNGNGHSEKKELFTLEEMGIVSIALERRNINPLDVEGNRNQILATSTFETADGRSFQVGDVALFADMGGCGCHSGQPVSTLFSEMVG